MKSHRTVLALLSVFACAHLFCSPPDVRIGTGDGDGVKLSYRMLGKGRPLVVIHDGPGYEKSLMYRGFDGFSSDMRVLYYDQRGCGQSEPLSPSTSCRISDNVQDLEDLRQYFHFRKMSLAAHGWGAVIALEYARAYPKRVESIILIAPVSPFTPEMEVTSIVDRLPVEAGNRIRDALDDPYMSMVEKRGVAMQEIMPSLFYRPQVAEDLNLASLKYSAEVSLRLGEELKSLDLFPVLGEITQPTIVIVGRHDISIPVRDQMAYADGIKHSSAIVFNESGHFPFLEERDFFTNLVSQFLRHKGVPALADAVHKR